MNLWWRKLVRALGFHELAPEIPPQVTKEFRFSRRTVNFMGQSALHSIMINDLRDRARVERIDITGWSVGIVWWDEIEPERHAITDEITAVVSAAPRG